MKTYYQMKERHLTSSLIEWPSSMLEASRMRSAGSPTLGSAIVSALEKKWIWKILTKYDELLTYLIIAGIFIYIIK